MKQESNTEDLLIKNFDLEQLEERLELEDPFGYFWVIKVSQGVTYWWDFICYDPYG
jgi:hypothetical protein